MFFYVSFWMKFICLFPLKKAVNSQGSAPQEKSLDALSYRISATAYSDKPWQPASNTTPNLTIHIYLVSSLTKTMNHLYQSTLFFMQESLIIIFLKVF